MRLRTLAFIALFPPAAVAGPDSHVRENPTGQLPLAQALALALKQSPELESFSWEIRAAEARIIQARLRPNPELSLEMENVTGTRAFKSGDEAETTLQLSQLVELGGKRAARVNEARLASELAEWDYQIKRVEVLKRTTQAFVDVLVAQRRVALAEETAVLWEKAVPLTENRVEVGKASAAEVTRSNVAVALARIGAEQATRELLSAKATLAAQWGATAVSFESVTGNLDRLEPFPSLDTLKEQLGRNPELARWTTERERREAALRLARSQAAPDLTAYAGPRVVGRADDTTIGMLGFSLPLPLFNRNQGNIAEARANLAKARPEERAAESRAFAALNVVYQTLARAAGEIAILKEKVLPGASEGVELLTIGYESGRFSQLEILDARRTLTDARNQYLRALADYHKALAEVEALTAAPPSRQPASRR